MVKYPESIIFVDVFCLEHDLDAANLIDPGFSKAWRNLQFLDLPDVSFVAGARRGQPYGFRFCESFAQFAIFGLAMHFSWQAQDAANLIVSDFAKASRNLLILGLARCIFRGRCRTRQPYGFRFCESFAQFAAFGLARCILCGRRRTRPTL